MLLYNLKVINAIFSNIDSINIYFKEGQLFIVKQNEKKNIENDVEYIFFGNYRVMTEKFP